MTQCLSVKGDFASEGTFSSVQRHFGHHNLWVLLHLVGEMNTRTKGVFDPQISSNKAMAGF